MPRFLPAPLKGNGAGRSRSIRHTFFHGGENLNALMRHLSRQVAFVVAGRQAFLPFLGIALRADSVALTRKWLGCVAQETVLAMLRGQLACTFADRDIVRLTGCSRASAFRAFRELTTFGLVERVAGGYAFASSAIQTLRLHMPRLRNSHMWDALVSAVFDGYGCSYTIIQCAGNTSGHESQLKLG